MFFSATENFIRAKYEKKLYMKVGGAAKESSEPPPQTREVSFSLPARIHSWLVALIGGENTCTKEVRTGENPPVC